MSCINQFEGLAPEALSAKMQSILPCLLVGLPCRSSKGLFLFELTVLTAESSVSSVSK